MNKCAILSCMGLGDGLISLVLSNNLKRNGAEVVTFHPFLRVLQPWFPELPLAPFPEEGALGEYERIFLFYEKSPWMQKLIHHCLREYPEKTCVLNPIATPNRDYPFWENGRFDGNLPFVENLFRFCSDVLELKNPTRANGIKVPERLCARKYPKRVILHPMSSRPGKNWPQGKFLDLNHELREEGFFPIFVLTKEERVGWENLPIEAPLFSSLSELAAFIYESGYMIGNDSGIGHLASCLGLPTVTICRNHLTANFWRPAWSRGEILFPPAWIPNIKWLRLRDKHWKKWISVGQVTRAFAQLS